MFSNNDTHLHFFNSLLDQYLLCHHITNSRQREKYVFIIPNKWNCQYKWVVKYLSILFEFVCLCSHLAWEAPMTSLVLVCKFHKFTLVTYNLSQWRHSRAKICRWRDQKLKMDGYFRNSVDLEIAMSSYPCEFEIYSSWLHTLSNLLLHVTDDLLF